MPSTARRAAHRRGLVTAALNTAISSGLLSIVGLIALAGVTYFVWGLPMWSMFDLIVAAAVWGYAEARERDEAVRSHRAVVPVIPAPTPPSLSGDPVHRR